ncbi:MAG: cbb3-type cytochrome c oxidase subunit I [Chloroflexi bacterium]|nr:cbb3-type cytochrome c oxidase subunit I [Chloroflexota bacterium]
MPRLSVWFIRASFVHLIISFTFGALMLSNKGAPYYPPLWRLLPAHIELVLFGWTVQLALGVAFWILPRFGGSRGDERPVAVAFWVFNAGVLLAGFGPVLAAPPAIILVGRAAETLAILLFFINAWPRIKPLMTKQSKAASQAPSRGWRVFRR